MAVERDRTALQKALTRLGFGVHPLGPSRANLPLEEGAELMQYAYENGIRVFDTAQFYHTYSYIKCGLEKIRQADGYDGEPFLCSKSLEPGYEDMLAAIEEACRETGRDSIDLFLLHQAEPGWQQERADARKALIDAKQRGLVKWIGLSTHHQDVVEEAANDDELDAVFALFNRDGLGIRRGDDAGSAAGMKEALESCQKAGKAVLLMKIFGGGNLTTDYQKASGYIFRECQELFDTAVVGFTSRREIDELLQFCSGKMARDYNPPTDHKRLRIDRGDCIGCGSCVRICASKAMHYSKEDGLAEISRERCVSCGYCAIACPQRAIVFW